MNYLKLTTIIVLLILTSFLSCKKGDVGPKGDSYDPNKFYGTKEGFFKGSVTKRSLYNDGVYYHSDNIIFNGKKNEYDSYYKITPGWTLINIYKQYAGDGEELKDGEITMNFYVNNLNSFKQISGNNIGGFSLVKDIGNSDYLEMDATYFPLDSTTLYNLSYDSTQKILTGSLKVLEITSTDTLKISGSFSTKLIHIE